MIRKKQQIKTLVFMLMLFVALISIFSIKTKANAASTLSLAELQNKYPAGSRWTSSFDGSSTCAGFARLLCYEAFGGDGYINSSSVKWTKITSSSYIDNGLKAGDRIRYTPGSVRHSVFITGVYNDKVSIADCNFDNNCGIRWTTISRSSLKKGFVEAWSAPYSLESNTKKEYGADVWVSKLGKGYQHYEAPKATSGIVGERYFVWFKIADKNTGSLYNENTNYTATITIYNPDGSVLYSYSYSKSSSNWIGIVPTHLGKHRINIKITGDICCDYSQYFNVSFNGKIQINKPNLSLSLANKKTDTLTVSFINNWPTGATYSANYDNNIISCSRKNTTYTVTAKKAGTTYFTISVKDEHGSIIKTERVKIVVSDDTKKLTCNTHQSAQISKGGAMAYYTFTPSSSGKYVIYSTGSDDTRVYLYDATSGKQIASNDDSGEAYNFNLQYNLVAGKQYKFAVRFYSSSKTGKISFCFGPVYKITYNANGGYASPAAQEKDYGLPLKLTTQKPIRSGYTFMGWSTNKNAINATYKPGSSYNGNSSCTLYAIWKPVYNTLQKNSVNNAQISKGGTMAYYTFTPSSTGKYVIYSIGSDDTRVYLYDSNKNILASNDDSGSGRNFRLQYNLVAGKQYKFGVRFYNGLKTGKIFFCFVSV